MRNAIPPVRPDDDDGAGDEHRDTDQELDEVGTDDAVGDQEHGEVADVGLGELVGRVGQGFQSFTHADADGLAESDELGVLAGLGLELLHGLLGFGHPELLGCELALGDGDHLLTGLAEGHGRQADDRHEQNEADETVHVLSSWYG